MTARGKAKKEFAKEQELDKLRWKNEQQIQAKLDKQDALDAKLALMSPDERAAYDKNLKRTNVIAALILVAIVIAIAAAIASSRHSTDQTSAVVTPTTSDSSTVSLPCNHFRNVMRDISKGILSTPEIRQKMKEVNGLTDISQPADVQSAAIGLLAAATQDDAAAFLTAVSAMDKACSAAGS
jgi:hypothetical protein